MILLQDSGHASEGITFIIAWVHHSITQLHYFIVTYIYITLSPGDIIYHPVISFSSPSDKLYHLLYSDISLLISQ